MKDIDTVSRILSEDPSVLRRMSTWAFGMSLLAPVAMLLLVVRVSILCRLLLSLPWIACLIFIGAAIRARAEYVRLIQNIIEDEGFKKKLAEAKTGTGSVRKHQ